MAKLSIGQVAWVLSAWRWRDPAVAVAIVMAESGGVTDKVRDARLNPAGGNDRGLWQINDKWHPNVDDRTAFSPARATAYVHELTNGGADWSCWSYGPPGRCRPDRSRTDLDLAAARRAVANPTPMTIEESLALDNIRNTTPAQQVGVPALGAPGGVIIDATDKALEPVVDAAEAVTAGLGGLVDLAAKLLRTITSLEFWRRAGLVAAGVAVLAVSIVVLVRTVLIPTPTGGSAS